MPLDNNFDNFDPDNLDRDDYLRRRPLSHRHATTSLENRLPTPATGATSSNARKSNNKYEDVLNFYGIDKDRDKWESWRIHLEFKFWASWELFEDEYFKIIYIRDYCKKTAFDIIKVKVNIKNSEYYVLSDDML